MIRLKPQGNGVSVFLLLGGLIFLTLSDIRAENIPLTFELDADDSQSGDASVGDLDILLGDLASRSQGKPLTLGGADPIYVVVGTDSRSGEGYSYLTDVNYTGGGVNESVETGFDSFTFSRTLSVSHAGRTGVTSLVSSGNCAHDNTGPSGQAYCAIFGPEIWTEPFNAVGAKALAVDYAASASDNYEVYGFLVEVSCTDPGDLNTCDYGGGKSENATDPLNTHSLFLHRRGKNADWNTAVGIVPSTGIYRFRFVDGAFDQTGGFALGTNFYIDGGTVILGTAQTITFPDPGDRIIGDGAFAVSPTTTSGLPVDLVSATIGVCTVAGPSGSVYTVTPVSQGACVLVADAAAGNVGLTSYSAAPTTVRSFSILADSTAPNNSGPPTVLVVGNPQTGTTLTLDEGVWGTGGSEITSTTFQWLIFDGASDTEIPGATENTLCVPDDALGAQIKVRVTKTNALGSTSATSAPTAAVTQGTESCARAQAPTVPVPVMPWQILAALVSVLLWLGSLQIRSPRCNH